MTLDNETRADYRDVFGKDPEPWRGPLGALRLTLAGDAPWTLERARHECEELVRVLNEVEPSDYVCSQSPHPGREFYGDGACAECGFTPPAPLGLRSVVGGVLRNAMNYPEKVASRILGQDMGPLIDRATEKILAAGYRKIDVTEEMVDIVQERIYDDLREGDRPVIRAALEAVIGVQS